MSKDFVNEHWDIAQARKLYNIAQWSDQYFDVNAQGEVSLIFPDKAQPEITFSTLLAEIQALGLTAPVLVRFNHILHDRVHKMHAAFAKAQAANAYQGHYLPVYPIKVNQQRRVVEEILQAGAPVGLEAGSKPELMAVMALSGQSSRVIICNGYKDREYIRLALIAQSLGHQVYLILEKKSELATILEEAERLKVVPQIGVRARLATLGKGNWQNTGGEKSKFGLTAGQILEVVTELAQACRLDSLKVLHVHLGSQIANLTDIKAGMQECAQFYAALRAAHAPIELVDVGGGLGIDYEGTRSRGYCSRNYAIEDYAQAVIVAFQQICETAQLPHPDIITESGRAMTAHHAVLMTQVIDWDMAPVTPPATANSYAMVTWFEQAVKQLNETDAPEYYRDADLKLTQAHQDFAQGRIGLNERAAVEARYYALVQQLPHFLNPQIRAHRVILEQLHEKMAIKYFCNFSIFQSLPDVWAIKQIFPIMPLTGLLQAPTQRVVLQDLTCDSDGRIDTYVDGHGIEHSLPLPALVQGEKNYLAFFLVGAYQEILGDMHNLFGDTDSVHVALDAKGSYTLEDASLGDKVETVLRHVNYEPQKLIRTYKQQLKNSDLTPRLKREYLDILVSGLSGYTYFEEEV